MGIAVLQVDPMTYFAMDTAQPCNQYMDASCR